MNQNNTQSNNHLRNQIYLAGLLHDIGKFYQRVDDNSAGKSKILSEDIKNVTGSICPQYKGNYSRKHVLYTAQFIEELIKTNNRFNINRDELKLFRLAAAHHAPGNFHEQIIQLADHLSAGLDRDDAPEKTKDIEFENDPTRFKKVRMRSLFEQLFTNEESDFKFELPLTQNNIHNENDFFPQSEIEEHPNYKKLWDEFTIEIQKINGGEIKSYAENILSILETYTSFIPSSTMHLPDVSLYDHLKTTAAFSLCLHDYAEENKINTIENLKETNPFILIGGDISGIQHFIYNVISKSAAKNLKGRSFYINLLIENIIQVILNELNLFNGNIVYGSGGKFYIIAPNTKVVKEKLTNIHSRISEEMLVKHQDELYLALSNIAFGFDILTKGDPGKLWKNLNDQLTKEKKHKYFDRLQEHFNMFEPIDTADMQQDEISGKMILENEGAYIRGDLFVHEETTKTYVKLGQLLKNTKYIIYTDANNSINENEVKGLFGKKFRFIGRDEQKNELHKLDKKSKIFCLNEPKKLQLHPDLRTKYMWYGGNKYPTDIEGNPISFDKLANEDDSNLKRLGVLKMDVDSLGKAFISGLPERKRNFSAYSTMSRSLDLFFSGYLNVIQQNNSGFNDNTYILYSGGDDLVIIGGWYYITRIAEKINDDFKRYTCNNPKLSLSGGISVVPAKFPILKAIQEAENGETLAKNHTVDKQKKNAISILGMPLKWDSEYLIVKSLKDEISYFLTNGKLPKSFISRIRNYCEISKINKHGEMENIQALWMSAYELQRLKSRLSKFDEDAKNFLEQVKQDIYTNKFKNQKINTNYHYLQLIDIACRLAELETRTKNQ
jgi:CRISPR-associated protein Csm1